MERLPRSRIRKMACVRIASAFFLLVITTLLPAATVYATGDKVSEGPGAVARTLERLGSITVKGYESQIPPAVRPLLTTLKHQLRDVILQAMNDKSVPWNTPQELKAHVLSILRSVGVTVGGKDEDQEGSEGDESDREFAYNSISRIDIDLSPNHPGVVIAQTTLWVMCGEDTSLYMFTKHDGTWRLALAQEAATYDTIGGAQGLFGYALSPPDRHGGFFLVTANINPWCTSNWQSLRYAVLRIGRTPAKPNVLLKRRETIYLGNAVDNRPYTITTRPDGFRLDFYGDWYWRSGLGAALQCAEYKVTESKVLVTRDGLVIEDAPGGGGRSGKPNRCALPTAHRNR